MCSIPSIYEQNICKIKFMYVKYFESFTVVVDRSGFFFRNESETLADLLDFANENSCCVIALWTAVGMRQSITELVRSRGRAPYTVDIPQQMFELITFYRKRGKNKFCGTSMRCACRKGSGTGTKFCPNAYMRNRDTAAVTGLATNTA